LSAAEEVNFDEISQSLVRFAGEMVSYPEKHLYGREIRFKMQYLRVNLKMMELTRTRLPVQVIEHEQRHFDPTII
jgi:hypothetical protein